MSEYRRTAGSILDLSKVEHSSADLLERTNSLLQASELILQAQVAEGLLQIAVDAARDLTGARLAAAGYGSAIGVTSVDPGLGSIPMLARTRGRLLAEIAKTGDTLRLTDEQFRSHESWNRLPNSRLPLRGLLVVPLRNQAGETRGHILASDKSDGGEFTGHDEDLLSRLATIASGVLQLLEAKREAEQRAAEAEEDRRTLHALMEFAPAGIAITDGSDGRIHKVSRHGRELTGRPHDHVEGIGIDEHSSKWGMRRPDGTGLAESHELPLSRATKNGETTINEEWVIERPDGTRITTLCSAGPVCDELGRVIGGVMAWRDITEIRKSRTELEKAYERERHSSEVLQRALAPRKLSVGPGYRTASRYVPAHSGHEIGGDFYDVFTTANGKVAVVIGDVAGKGLDAAALAAATRSTVRAFSFDSSSAGQALTLANSVLYPQQPWGSFVTISLAIIDLPTGRITYASAGHPPAAVRRKDGSIEFMMIGCPPFGLAEDMDFDEHEIHLHPGDKIVFYTDGVSEARHEAILFGTEGVERILQDHGHCAPEDFLNKLLGAAGKWAEGELKDDAAVIVIERAAND